MGETMNNRAVCAQLRMEFAGMRGGRRQGGYPMAQGGLMICAGREILTVGFMLEAEGQEIRILILHMVHLLVARFITFRVWPCSCRCSESLDYWPFITW